MTVLAQTHKSRRCSADVFQCRFWNQGSTCCLLCRNSAHSVGAGGRHSCVLRPSSLQSTRRVQLFPHPAGPMSVRGSKCKMYHVSGQVVLFSNCPLLQRPPRVEGKAKIEAQQSRIFAQGDFTARLNESGGWASWHPDCGKHAGQIPHASQEKSTPG